MVPCDELPTHSWMRLPICGPSPWPWKVWKRLRRSCLMLLSNTVVASELHLEKANNASGKRLRQLLFLIQKEREEKPSRGCLARVHRHHFGLFFLVTCVNTPDCSLFILINIAGCSCSWFLHFKLATYLLFLTFCPSVFSKDPSLWWDVLRSRLESSDVAHLELSQASLLRHRCAHDFPPDFIFRLVVVPAPVSCDLDHRERSFSSHWKLHHHLAMVITSFGVPCCCDMTAVLVVSSQAVLTVERVDIWCYLVITGWTTGQPGTVAWSTPSCLFSWSEHPRQWFWFEIIGVTWVSRAFILLNLSQSCSNAHTCPYTHRHKAIFNPTVFASENKFVGGGRSCHTRSVS